MQISSSLLWDVLYSLSEWVTVTEGAELRKDQLVWNISCFWYLEFIHSVSRSVWQASGPFLHGHAWHFHRFDSKWVFDIIASLTIERKLYSTARYAFLWRGKIRGRIISVFFELLNGDFSLRVSLLGIIWEEREQKLMGVSLSTVRASGAMFMMFTKHSVRVCSEMPLWSQFWLDRVIIGILVVHRLGNLKPILIF